LAETALPGRPARTAAESALATVGGTGDALTGPGTANTIARVLSCEKLA
jgi:hypothetical protein